MPDLTHLSGRTVVPAGTPESAESVATRRLHEFFAAEYVKRVAAGDPGPAIAYLNNLRHETEGVDPWRLVEQVAAQALARQPRKDR